MSDDTQKAEVLDFEHVDSRGAEGQLQSPIAQPQEDAVEDKYIPMMDFAEALKCLFDDALMSRMGWIEEDSFIRIREGDEERQPYLEFMGEDGMWSPWTPTNIDILSEDWFIV